MNDDPEAVNVLYAKIQEQGQSHAGRFVVFVLHISTEKKSCFSFVDYRAFATVS